MKIRVLVSNEAQFSAAVKSAADEIVLESAGFAFEKLESLGRETERAGKTLAFAFPSAFRPSDVKIFEAAAPLLQKADFSGFLVRSHETLSFLRNAGLAGNRTADHNLYVWNKATKCYFLSHGYDRVTAPVELTGRELKDVGFEGEEIIVYGRLPMMVTANCLFRTTSGCDRKGTSGILTDRIGHEMVVFRDCRICQNTILNGLPLSLFTEAREIRELGFGSVRLVFTSESKEETFAVINRFVLTYRDGQTVPEPEGLSFTRGHFRNKTE